MDTHRPKPALWKSVIIAGVVLLVVAGLFDVLFNLPVVTGNVPQ
jgi:TRAP-type mannitol/chloroaromatic compound transport system permease small subunit